MEDNDDDRATDGCSEAGATISVEVAADDGEATDDMLGAIARATTATDAVPMPASNESAVSTVKIKDAIA